MGRAFFLSSHSEADSRRPRLLTDVVDAGHLRTTVTTGVALDAERRRRTIAAEVSERVAVEGGVERSLETAQAGFRFGQLLEMALFQCEFQLVQLALFFALFALAE